MAVLNGTLILHQLDAEDEPGAIPNLILFLKVKIPTKGLLTGIPGHINTMISTQEAVYYDLFIKKGDVLKLQGEWKICRYNGLKFFQAAKIVTCYGEGMTARLATAGERWVKEGYRPLLAVAIKNTIAREQAEMLEEAETV